MKSSITLLLLLLFACTLHTSEAGRLEQLLRQVSFDVVVPQDVSTELTDNKQNRTCVDCKPDTKGCECNCHGCYCTKMCSCHKEVGVHIMLSDEEPHVCCRPELSLEFHVDDKMFSDDMEVRRVARKKQFCFEVDDEDFCFELKARIHRQKVMGDVGLTKPKKMKIGEFDFPL